MAYLRPYMPRAVRVKAGPGGRPVAVEGLPVSQIREQWLVEDGWWTEEPLRRHYFEVVLSDGRNVVVFRDESNRIRDRGHAHNLGRLTPGQPDRARGKQLDRVSPGKSGPADRDRVDRGHADRGRTDKGQAHRDRVDRGRTDKGRTGSTDRWYLQRA